MSRSVFCLVTTVVLLESCFLIFEADENSILREVYNRQGSRKAIVFSKGGNAVTNTSLHVTVSGYDYRLAKDETGNALILSPAPDLAGLDSLLGTTWLADDTLQITYRRQLQPYKQETATDGVFIVYRPIL